MNIFKSSSLPKCLFCKRSSDYVYENDEAGFSPVVPLKCILNDIEKKCLSEKDDYFEPCEVFDKGYNDIWLEVFN